MKMSFGQFPQYINKFTDADSFDKAMSNQHGHHQCIVYMVSMIAFSLLSIMASRHD